MKSTFLSILLISFLLVCNLYSNAQYDSVGTTRPNSINYRFSYMGINADSKLLKVLVKPNKEALKWIKKGRRKAFLASCFAFTGGYIIGWQISNELLNDGDNPLILNNPLSFSVGAASLVVSFGITRWSNQNFYNGVQLWNAEIRANQKHMLDIENTIIQIDSSDNKEIEINTYVVQSEEERKADLLSNKEELNYSVYLRLEEIELGDYVFFDSRFGERIVGVVVEKGDRKSIQIKTFPSAGNVLIQGVNLDKLRKIIQP